jgi:hypothetical protein
MPSTITPAGPFAIEKIAGTRHYHVVDSRTGEEDAQPHNRGAHTKARAEKIATGLNGLAAESARMEKLHAEGKYEMGHYALLAACGGMRRKSDR